MGEPIDRAALREKARAFWCGRCVTSPGTLESPCEMCGSVSGTVLALLDALDAAEREADRWRHGVPVEGDYVCPTSLALDQARADLRAYGGHRDDCHIAIWMRCADEPPAPACTCGYSEALARAEGR